MTDAGFSSADIDTSKPQSARMYDYFLGGKDNYPVDAAAAEKVISLFPAVREMARVNRDFMHRASRSLAERGIRQFLDIGTGIPTRPNLHQVVQGINPSARVVYADNDPIVLRHAEALLHSTPEGSTTYIQADVREPGKILAAARDILDFGQPIALSLVALLHLVADEDDPRRIVAELLGSLSPAAIWPCPTRPETSIRRPGSASSRSTARAGPPLKYARATNSPVSSRDLNSSNPA